MEPFYADETVTLHDGAGQSTAGQGRADDTVAFADTAAGSATIQPALVRAHQHGVTVTGLGRGAVRVTRLPGSRIADTTSPNSGFTFTT